MCTMGCSFQKGNQKDLLLHPQDSHVFRSFVYANALAMTHDEKTYKNPDEFNPDRFKPQSEGGAGEPIPIGQFGFGRRLDYLEEIETIC